MKRNASTIFGLLCTALLAISIGISCASSTANRGDDGIDRAVKHALYDHEQVNLLQVEISTSGGIVYLSGDVETYQHKEQAERLATGVDGVAAVVNKIHVQP